MEEASCLRKKSFPSSSLYSRRHRGWSLPSGLIRWCNVYRGEQFVMVKATTISFLNFVLELVTRCLIFLFLGNEPLDLKFAQNIFDCTLGREHLQCDKAEIPVKEDPPPLPLSLFSGEGKSRVSRCWLENGPTRDKTH